MILVLEKRFEDIDGSIDTGWAGFIQEDGLHYANCIAGYNFGPTEFTEDSCRHDNNLINPNETKVALDKRYDTDLTTAELNGENNGVFLKNLKDVPTQSL
jgi:hypothetical protein